MKRRFDLRQGTQATVELVSENAVTASGLAAGQGLAADGGFLFGQLASSSGESLAAMRVEVIGPTAVLPVYMDERGAPNSHLNMTSGRGQFMLLNVSEGTYLITPVDPLGIERASHIIHIGKHEGVVRKLSMGEKRIVRGKVMNANASNAKVGEATVQLLGNSKKAVTTADGSFTLGPVYVDCASPNYLQVEKSGFYRNRLDYACGAEGEVKNLYVFPASYVDALAAESMTPLGASVGVIVGHVSFNQSVKMQLWGTEELNPESTPRGKDFYFDEDGILNTSRNRTTRNGNFTILDAPEGLSYIQAFSKENNTLSFWPIFVSPSTVNIYVQ